MRLRLRKKYEKKITFLTTYNLFEYIIISFGLCNALNHFQIFINDILRDYFNIFYFAYFDNILIYNNIKEKHIKYIRKILKKVIINRFIFKY